MKAIILSAGIGSRIRPLTDSTPKSLLKVGSKTILERMIENIQGVGISEAIVVIGYLEEAIKSFIKEKFPTVKVQYVKNEKYLETNTGYSLMLTKNLIGKDDFVKFDADVVFEKRVLEKLIQSAHPSALCIDRTIRLEAEEVKVETDKNGSVLKVSKKLNPHTAAGESIGIEKISKDAGSVLFHELEILMKDVSHWKDYYDDSYTTLVEKGVPFGAVDITGLKWVEIDTHDDYRRAQELFAEI